MLDLEFLRWRHRLETFTPNRVNRKAVAAEYLAIIENRQPELGIHAA